MQSQSSCGDALQHDTQQITITSALHYISTCSISKAITCIEIYKTLPTCNLNIPFNKLPYKNLYSQLLPINTQTMLCILSYKN